MSQASPFDNILAQCRDLFAERLVTAVSAMLEQADDALLELMQGAREPRTQALYRETRDKVLAQRETIETQFRARYLREFQQRSNHAKKIGGTLEDIDLDSIELALVGEDDLNETLKVNAMAARLRQYCEDELVALDQRVGVLFGDAGLHPDDNPFAPQAVCDAYKQTCSQVDSNVAVRMVLLKLFDDHVLDEIRGIYKAVNALLVQNAILPKIRGVGGVRQERDRKTEAREESAETEDGAGGQDFFTLLQNLVTKNPVGTAQPAPGSAAGHAPAGMAPGGAVSAGVPPGAPGVPSGGAPAFIPAGAPIPQILESPDLLSSLTRVQVGDVSAVTGHTTQLAAIVNEPGTTNVLRELKDTSLGSGMSQMDAMTLDIVALLFDQLFDDPNIPIAVKGLIGRLQIPMLKVAIADKAFFSRKHHPARQMLDTLGEIAARMPDDVDASSPAFVRLDEILRDLIKDFEDDFDIFDTVREQLQTVLAEEDQRLEQETQTAGKQIEQEESLSLAKTVAQTEIKMRLRGATFPDAVTDFLVKQWIKVLILTQIRHGESSEEWKSAIETMDLLIWSVEPKNTLEERRELVGKVPQLHKHLSDALAQAGVEDEVRMGLLRDLRKLHSEMLTPSRATAVSPEVASAPATAAENEPAPHAEPPAIEPATPVAEIPGATEPGEELLPAAEPAEPAPEPVAGFELPTLEFTPSAPREPAAETEPPAKPAAAAEPELPVPGAEPSPTAEAEEPAVEPVAKFELPTLDFAPSAPGAPALDAEPSPAAEPAAPKPEPVAELELPSLDFAPSAPPESVAREKPGVQPAAPPPAAKQPVPLTPPTPADLELPSLESKPPAQAKPAQPKPVVPPMRPAPAAAKPRQVATLDFSAPVKVNNPFGEGEVEVNDLDFTVALRGPSDAKPPPALPPNLVIGCWVSIKLRGETEKHRIAKLNYISPLKTRFLFIDQQGKTALECTQAELVKLLEIGEVTMAAEPKPAPPLFDRIAEGVVNKLSGKK
ncbi:MAG TPA: DUF1631 family protein [Burkholderiales bacterium]|nr:DUF1631 family protein [Burkholderiales bacterium]